MRKVSVGLVILVAGCLIVGTAAIVILILKPSKLRTNSYVDTLKNDKDPEARAKAAEALGAMGPAARDAVPALLAALEDNGQYYGPGFFVWRPLINVRDVAAQALVKIGGPETVQGSARLLSHRDSQVATRAAKILEEIGWNAKAAVPDILTTLDQNNQGDLIRALLVALERIRLDPGTPEAEQAMPVLKKGFQHWPREWGDQRLRAVRLFHNIAPEDRSPITALIDILNNGNGNSQALATLTEFGADAAPALVAALSHTEDAVRSGAKWALPQLPPEQTIPLLRQRLTDASASARAGSAHVLGALGPKAEETVPALERLLTDPDGLVRVETATALWSIDQQALTCFPVWVDALHNDNKDVRQAAEQALQRIGPKDAWAAERLSTALKDKDPQVRLQAAQALGQIGPAAKGVAPALLGALDDQNQEVRLAVARALARVDPK